MMTDTAMVLTANLFSSDGKLPIRLVALSAAGTVATTGAPPPRGSIAVLARNHQRLFCTVEWVEGERFGLRFDDELDDWRMEAFVRTEDRGNRLTNGSRLTVLDGGVRQGIVRIAA